MGLGEMKLTRSKRFSVFVLNKTVMYFNQLAIICPKFAFTGLARLLWPPS